MIKIYDNSKNYTCQVINLPVKIPVKGLDNLVEVNYQGNSCLVGKDVNENELQLFFPAECQLSPEFLSENNLYRHSHLNKDGSKSGFFEDNGRVKAIKFKGIISTGFVIPITSLTPFTKGGSMFLELIPGNEFNEINGFKICQKFIRPKEKTQGMSNPRTKVLDGIIDSKMAPEHPDTSHLLKNIHKLSIDDYIAVTYKLHGTSARYYNTLTKRNLSTIERIAKFFGAKVLEEDYDYVSASRRVVKSVGFEELPNKNHFFKSGDLWSEVGKTHFKGKLNKGEAVYCEIIGKTYTGEAIQHGYTYGLDKPKVFIYRISNINSQGIEVDLSYLQMKDRAKQLDIEVCPELFYGKLSNFLETNTEDGGCSSQRIGEDLDIIFYKNLLEKSSILDNSIIEEGFCVRKDNYGKPDIFKIKSKLFLLHEGKALDKEVLDIEEEQAV